MIAQRDRTAAAPAVSAEPRRYQREVLVVVVGSFMSALSTTMINLAITDLQNIFGAALATVQWVVTGYVLSLAVAVPAVGWLANRVGIKRVYLGALATAVGWCSSRQPLWASRTSSYSRPCW